MPTCDEINKLNRAFWAEQNLWAEQTLEIKRIKTDPWIVQRAMRVLATEEARGVIPYFRTDFYTALRDADIVRREVLKDHGRRGGQANKRDILQERIVEIVRVSPEITCHELLSRLRAEAPGPVIEDIDDEEISFKGSGVTLESAPLSGLKDRLSRAKKNCRSR